MNVVETTRQDVAITFPTMILASPDTANIAGIADIAVDTTDVCTVAIRIENLSRLDIKTRRTHLSKRRRSVTCSIMAYDPRNVKYSPNTHQRPNVTGYGYSGHPSQHFQQTDENRNENNLRRNKELCPQILQQSSSTQTVQKVDAATMTDPLQIDFRLTSEYLARCSSTLGLPYVTKYEDCSTNSTTTCQEVRPKIEFEIEPQHINGMLVYHCPECAYRFDDREALHEHLEDHKQRPHICDICGASLKRKEHLDRHKQGHNKDRPYQCNMCCKAFKRNEHLARHMITHSGSKNQICTECGKAFYRKDHLKKHLQSHNSGRGKHLNISQNNPNDQQPSDQGLSSFAMIMRQSGPPPLSILRT